MQKFYTTPWWDFWNQKIQEGAGRPRQSGEVDEVFSLLQSIVLFQGDEFVSSPVSAKLSYENLVSNLNHTKMENLIGAAKWSECNFLLLTTCNSCCYTVKVADRADGLQWETPPCKPQRHLFSKEASSVLKCPMLKPPKRRHKDRFTSTWEQELYFIKNYISRAYDFAYHQETVNGARILGWKTYIW